MRGVCLGTDSVGEFVKEVVVEYAGDAPEQMNVNILFPEDFIDVGACAA